MGKRTTTQKRIEELRRMAAAIQGMTPLERGELYRDVMELIVWWVDTYGEYWLDRVDGMEGIKKLLELTRTLQRRAGMQIIADYYPGGGQSERPTSWMKHFGQQ